MATPTDASAPRALFEPRDIVPSAEQLAIQLATERSLIVEANAGAAKTTTLALRMAESWRRGTAPEGLLALTFTAPACEALRGALIKIGVPAGVVQRLRIQTFEDFCTQVLAEQQGGRVPVLDQDEQLSPYVWQAVQRVEERPGERWRDELVMPSLGDSALVEEFLRLGTRLKGSLRDLLERGENTVSPAYADSIGVDYSLLRFFLAYERIRRGEHADRPLFRGSLDATYDLARGLHEGDSVQGLKSWPWSARVVVVDEMHDLNAAMFRVLREVLDSTPSFFCGVGDIDQVLHEAAGADARFMRDALAQQTTRLVRRLPLTHTHRFGRTLAIKAGRLANKPYASMAGHSTEIALIAYDSAQDCAERVVQAAQAWRARPRARMNQLAILLRHAHRSVAIENALLEADLPYSMRGLDSYLMRPEVLFVRGLLAVATDSLGSVADPHTRERVMRALVFFSGSRIEVEGREGESQESLLADAIRSVRDAPRFLQHFLDNQVLRNTTPSMRRRLEAAIALARERSGPALLGQMFEALDIAAIVREVCVSRQRRADALGNLVALQGEAMKHPSALAYFQSLNDAEQKQAGLKKSASLLIATVPAVKGLEFDQVLMPYLAHGEFPSPTGSDSEEQNLLYVGMTRARLGLSLFASRSEPSAFVQRMGYKPSVTP